MKNKNDVNVLFQQIKINELVLKNRFVMSSTADYIKNNQVARMQRFEKLAQGGVGLIFSGGMSYENINSSWLEVIENIHKNGGKFVFQSVVSVGFKGFNFDEGRDCIAVSELSEDNVFFNNPYLQYAKHHAATEQEINMIIDFYAKAAENAKKVGADGIAIHSAHQSLLSQFLSPITNKRTDKWGGSIENRARIHEEIYRTIRAKVGKNFPIFIKLGVEDLLPGGLQFAEGKSVAKLIVGYGYDALEISQGLQDMTDWAKTSVRTVMRSSDEAYFRLWAREIKKLVDKPIIMSGGLRDYAMIKEIIEGEEADLVGMCRPLIRETDLINRWQRGDTRRATCISCNKCLTELVMKGEPLECYLDKK